MAIDLVVQGHNFSVIEKRVKAAGGETYVYLRTFISVGRHPVTGRTRQVEVAGRTMEELEGRIEKLLHFSPVEAGMLQTDMTFGTWFVEMGMYRRDSLEEQSFRSEQSIYRNHIHHCFDKTPLNEMTEEALIRWQEERISAGVRNNRIRNAFGILSIYLDLAVRRRYLTHNPCRFSLIVPEEQLLRKAICEDAVRTLLVDNASEEFVPLIAVTLLCALRIAEATALSWEDLDESMRTLTIHRQASLHKGANGQLYIKPYTKNKKSRTICIPECALWYFQRQRSIQREMKRANPDYLNPDHLIFTDETGGIIDRDGLSRWYKSALRLAAPEATIHDLRRTGVSRAVELSHDIDGAMTYLGHSVKATTYRYLDGGEDASKRIAILMDSALIEIIKQYAC